MPRFEHVIGITGGHRGDGVGKDTAAAIMVEEFGFCRFGIADAGKEDLAEMLATLEVLRGRCTSPEQHQGLALKHLEAMHTRPDKERYRRMLLEYMNFQRMENPLHWLDLLELRARALNVERLVIPDIRVTRLTPSFLPEGVVNGDATTEEAGWVHARGGTIVWIPRYERVSGECLTQGEFFPPYADHKLVMGTDEELREGVRALMAKLGIEPVATPIPVALAPPAPHSRLLVP